MDKLVGLRVSARNGGEVNFVCNDQDEAVKVAHFLVRNTHIDRVLIVHRDDPNHMIAQFYGQRV